MNARSVYVGWDPREASAFAVARHSMAQHISSPIDVHSLVLSDLQDKGLYTRPHERDDAGRLIDVLSKREDYDGAISTEHANARFAVPFLAPNADWVMFCDGDILVRADLNELFDGLDSRYAAYCVKHDYRPAETVKMDGQRQTVYDRKNWSSVILFSPKHPSMQRLTLDHVNNAPGRVLHSLFWLDDDEIGALDPAWNWLAGHSDPAIVPKLVHFTSGVPDMPGYADAPFASEWRDALANLAAADTRI